MHSLQSSIPIKNVYFLATLSESVPHFKEISSQLFKAVNESTTFKTCFVCCTIFAADNSFYGGYQTVEAAERYQLVKMGFQTPLTDQESERLAEGYAKNFAQASVLVSDTIYQGYLSPLCQKMLNILANHHLVPHLMLAASQGEKEIYPVYVESIVKLIRPSLAFHPAQVPHHFSSLYNVDKDQMLPSAEDLEVRDLIARYEEGESHQNRFSASQQREVIMVDDSSDEEKESFVDAEPVISRPSTPTPEEDEEYARRAWDVSVFPAEFRHLW